MPLTSIEGKHIRSYADVVKTKARDEPKMRSVGAKKLLKHIKQRLVVVPEIVEVGKPPIDKGLLVAEAVPVLSPYSDVSCHNV